MEAIAAVGLATSIIQLVQSAKTVISTIKEISNSTSGDSAETRKFRSLARTVEINLETAFGPKSASKYPNEEIKNCVETLRIEIEGFIGELDNFRSKRSNSVLQACIAMVKRYSRRDRIGNYVNTIQQMSNQISIHIITTTVPGMDGKLDKLISQGAGLETQLSKNMADLQSELRATTDTSKENSKLQQVVSDWVTRKDEFDAQSGCLRALYFPEIYRRQDDVKQAHEETFKWVMCDPNDNKDGGTNVLAGRADTPSRKGHAFLDWLRSNDAHHNVFCVFGKPGAGKSTLMRFIAHHGRLRSALENWAGDRHIVIAKYFFWNRGEQIQRSLLGLLRSLLLQILEHHRFLVPVAFPGQSWTIGGDKFTFSKDSLMDALKRVLDHTVNQSLCFFILIDGLDEFNDQEQNINPSSQEVILLEFLKMFHDRPCLKLCVSTRPYQTFKKQYCEGQSHWLALHDLTKSDIKTYAQERLGKDEKFMKLAVDDINYGSLVDEIVKAAEGVFLWVRLACDSLLAGITNADHIHDLQLRLRELPHDLKEFYEYILNSVSPEYQKKSARSLLLAISSSHRPRILVHHYLNDSARLTSKNVERVDFKSLHQASIRAKERITVVSKGLWKLTWTAYGNN